MPGAGLADCALVIAGAEGAAGAGEDDHAHGALGIGPVEGPMQLRFEIMRERVHPLRAVEGDGRDALVDAVEQLLILLLAARFFLVLILFLGHSSSFRSWALFGGACDFVRCNPLDRYIDGNDAGGSDYDGIEVECAEPAAVRDRELSECDQQACERLDIRALAAARAFED